MNIREIRWTVGSSEPTKNGRPWGNSLAQTSHFPVMFTIPRNITVVLTGRSSADHWRTKWKAAAAAAAAERFDGSSGVKRHEKDASQTSDGETDRQTDRQTVICTGSRRRDIAADITSPHHRRRRLLQPLNLLITCSLNKSLSPSLSQRDRASTHRIPQFCFTAGRVNSGERKLSVCYPSICRPHLSSSDTQTDSQTRPAWVSSLLSEGR